MHAEICLIALERLLIVGQRRPPPTLATPPSPCAGTSPRLSFAPATGSPSTLVGSLPGETSVIIPNPRAGATLLRSASVGPPSLRHCIAESKAPPTARVVAPASSAWFRNPTSSTSAASADNATTTPLILAHRTIRVSQ